VANKEYIERIKQGIFHLRKSNAQHVGSVPVAEVFQGRTIWKGEVEVFDLSGHPKVKRSYARTHGEPEEFMTSLELPPVTDAQSAVKLASLIKSKRRGQNDGGKFPIRCLPRWGWTKNKRKHKLNHVRELTHGLDQISEPGHHIGNSPVILEIGCR
jgi:hypothetical protein